MSDNGLTPSFLFLLPAIVEAGRGRTWNRRIYHEWRSYSTRLKALARRYTCDFPAVKLSPKYSDDGELGVAPSTDDLNNTTLSRAPLVRMPYEIWFKELLEMDS